MIVNDSEETAFHYADVQFADVQLLRYRVAGWNALSPQQRRYIFHLAEATLWGRDILWDQNCAVNLPVRRMLEHVLTHYQPADDADRQNFLAMHEYLRRVWFANGIHHHYGMLKFQPAFQRSWLEKALQQTSYEIDSQLLDAIFDPAKLAKRVNQSAGDDLLQTSAMNYYAPSVTQAEAEQFYARQKAQGNAECPPMYGMNSTLQKDADGELFEEVWRSGGRYGSLIDKIVEHLLAARAEAENDSQRSVLDLLVEFYRTGDLHTFDRYTIAWVSAAPGQVDFINGFTEVYGDPLGLKASWEGYVNITDMAATERTARLSQNAQWFEDHSPVAPEYKKEKCVGVSARVVEACQLGGDLYPASAIGINLPNSNWVRQQHGSKSVTIGNLTHAYAQAAKGNGFREEFVIDQETLQLLNRYDDALDDLHTDLHECLGHGSGRLAPGTDPDALKAYGSCIEEARADLFALYYIADPKLVELGLTPNLEAWHSQYYSYMMNGLLTQLVRIRPGEQIEEAHMRNRALIARWTLQHSAGAMQLVERDGKTYLKINDYEALRPLVGELLREIQRIKSEGDLQAAEHLIETYAVKIDPALHAEVLRRYEALHLAPYKGFINPRIVPLCDADGRLVDARIEYGESYDDQMLRLSRDYSL